jgi:two-component system, LytTR family, response regulator LytT
MFKILIIEDEELPAQQLKTYVSRYGNTFEVVGLERSIENAKNWLNTNGEPDLIISDIELLDGNAFRIYAERPVRCPIIFATAYQQFMVEAFRGNGLAYLLKPYNYEQFAEALDKFHEWFGAKQAVVNTPNQLTDNILAQLQTALKNTQKKTYRERLTVKKAQGVFILPVAKIHSIVAEGNFSKAQTDDLHNHILSQNIGTLEEELDPSVFFKINRSEIISLSAIERFENATNDRLAVYLRGVKEPLFVAAARVAEFRKWVG